MVGLTQAAKGKILLPFFLFITLSCSIIEDSDIQSQEELDTRLKLDRITFVEQTSDIFNPDAQTIVGTTTINDLGQITKIDWGGAIVVNNFQVGGSDASSPIMRFNYLDVVNVPNTISMSIVYNANGYPSKITNVADGFDFEFESWEYTYNSNNRIATVTTKRTVLDGSYDVEIHDELIYDGDNISQVNRIRMDLVAMTNIEQTIKVVRNSSNIITNILYEESPTQTRQFDQQCPNTNCYYYLSKILDPGTGPYGNPVAKYTISSVGVVSMEVIDSRKNEQDNTSFAPDRGPDIFVIHPLLILPDLFENGIETSQVFINDWWEVNPVVDTDFNITENRTVFVDFEYGVD